MSTLSIPTPRISPESDLDSRFDALVISTSTALPRGEAAVDFETVFDLDYCQPIAEPAPELPKPSARRIRVAPSEPRPVARAVRLTRRGRIVLVFTFLALALALMIPMGGWATATLTGGTPDPVRIVEVKPGETLYGIAGDLAEPGEVREMVLRIQELNSLPGGQIVEGQKLAVPRG